MRFVYLSFKNNFIFVCFAFFFKQICQFVMDWKLKTDP